MTQSDILSRIRTQHTSRSESGKNTKHENKILQPARSASSCTTHQTHSTLNDRVKKGGKKNWGEFCLYFFRYLIITYIRVTFREFGIGIFHGT